MTTAGRGASRSLRSCLEHLTGHPDPDASLRRLPAAPHGPGATQAMAVGAGGNRHAQLTTCLNAAPVYDLIPAEARELIDHAVGAIATPLARSSGRGATHARRTRPDVGNTGLPRLRVLRLRASTPPETDQLTQLRVRVVSCQVHAGIGSHHDLHDAPARPRTGASLRASTRSRVHPGRRDGAESA